MAERENTSGTEGKKRKLRDRRPHTSSQAVILHRGKRDRLVLLCALAGLLSGGISTLYRWVLVWTAEWQEKAFELANTPLRIILLFAGLVALGILVGWITKSEPLISGSGIPQVEGQLQGRIHPRWLPVMVKKFVAGGLCILGGLSLGREGPSIQLGAMAAQGMAKHTGRSEIESRYLIASGACAGLAAAFNAPLAGVMFGLEEVHKNFSKLALLSALMAAIVADLFSKVVFGTVSSLNIGLITLMPFRDYAIFLVVGVVMGLVGALFNKTLLSTQKLYRKLPVPLWVRMVIPFVFAGAIGLFSPDILGCGHDVIEKLNMNQYALGAMLLLLVGKFVFSMISYCSGAPGGIFFPLLVIGALTGAVLGKVCVLTLGIEENYVINLMLLGMVGMFAGVVRAPVTGIILVVEMSGSLTQLAGLTIVAAASTLVADYLGSEPIYDSLLAAMEQQETPEKETNEHHIIELSVPISSPLAGVSVKDVPWPQGCLVISILRGSRDKAEIPRGDTVIQPGDTVCVTCTADMECTLRSAFERDFTERLL